MVQITMYGLTRCSHCKRTMQFLTSAKVEFEVIWIDKLQEEERKKVIEEIYRISNSYSVPLVVKGEKWVLGFNREKLEELIKS
ncbi:MAG: glutaredoxin family protein [Archaeoglobaceae archaeon]|nr:glutaredoxin family protein [Archaeoglobaceae archaeon]MDW7989366.1 glutaredoxin family protein [Archaeoglobaceae archaeon]